MQTVQIFRLLCADRFAEITSLARFEIRKHLLRVVRIIVRFVSKLQIHSVVLFPEPQDRRVCVHQFALQINAVLLKASGTFGTREEVFHIASQRSQH